MDISNLFDKHTSNVTSGQKIVNEIMAARNVKTASDADKVRDDYRKHLEASKNKNAAAVMAVFTTRMNRWMKANKVAPKARKGGRKAAPKAAPVAPKAAPIVAKGSPSATIAKAAQSATIQSVNSLESIENGLRALVKGMKRADILSMKSKIDAIFTLALKPTK